MSQKNLESFLSAHRKHMDQFLAELDWQEPSSAAGWKKLRESMRYSLLQNGKRFRSVLSMLLAEQLGGDAKTVVPFAAAVEMVHTYSLIHDDMPCMDDDDLRRGQASNHRVYGEGMALLAGDVLQAEAFGLLAQSYGATPAVGLGLVAVLAQASGIQGMAGGQAIDIEAVDKNLNLEQLEVMHRMKTGALIRASCEGVGVVLNLDKSKREIIKEFGEHVGLAFQLKDDLLDSSEGNLEPGSYPDLVGLDKTNAILQQVSQKALDCLKKLNAAEGPLRQLIEFNRDRTV